MTIQQPTPYPLRMPAEMRAELEERAKANGRSLNQEIVAILQSYLSGQGAGFDIERFSDELAEKIVQKIKAK